MGSTRRDWLSTCLAMAALPDVIAATQHAHAAAPIPGDRFQTLDPQEAAEIESIASQILPSTNGPGAREAGVIYFIDRAMSTFAIDQRESYQRGMIEFQKKRRQLFPASATIASLTNDQQMTLLKSLETSEFFDLLRTHTVLGFLGNPTYDGNRGKVGWRQIGFDDQMAWQHPFGYYDAEANEQPK